MPLRLRATAHGDLDDVRAMAEAFHAEDGHPIDAKAAALIFRLGDSGVRAWLATAWLRLSGARTVGYVVAGPLIGAGPAWSAEVEELYVVPPRRAGMAGRILDLACRELAALGAAPVVISIAPADAAARCYYQTLGFIPITPTYAAKPLR